jgi:tetratricopeptide (TPR) repeat protein
LAWISFLRTDTDIADARLARAIAAFVEVGDWGGRSWADGLLAWVRMQQGRMAEAERIGTRALEEAADAGAVWSEGIMTVLVAVVSLWTGRIDRAIELGGRSRTIFDELGDAYGRMQATMPFSRAHLMQGRFADAFAALDHARTFGDQLTDPTMRMLPLVCAAQFAAATGDDAHAHAALAELGDLLDGSRIVGDRSTTAGIAALQRADVGAAVACLTTAWNTATSDAARACIGGPIALAYSAAGRTGDARAVIENARVPEVGTFLDALQLSWAAALLEARLGHRDAAFDELDRALRIADSSESLLDQAITRHAVAAVKEALGESDAAAARCEADERYRALQLTTTGWQTAFACAVGSVPAAGSDNS